jgi:hypothetical protein
MSQPFRFHVLMAATCLFGLLTDQASSRPSVGRAKDSRELAALGDASRPTREEIRDQIVAAAKACWLNNKSQAFSGLALRTNDKHPIVPHGYYLTFSGSRSSPRYLNIHIIPADDPDGGYIVLVDQESQNLEAAKAIEGAIDRLEAKYSKSFLDNPNQPLC